MRSAHLFPRLFVAVLVLLPAVGRADAVNILFFGNSFTYQSNVPELVGQLAVADGYEAPRIVAATKSGRNLAYHLNRVAVAPRQSVDHPSIAGRQWDYVVIQGHSIEATRLGDAAAFRSDAQRLFEMVRDHPSGRGVGVEAVLYQTWAREASHGMFPDTFESPAQMQAEVNEQYRLAHEQIQARHGARASRIAPVGEAFAAAEFARDLYGGDHYHASPKGSLLAAMMLYRTLYGEQVGDIAYEDVATWAQVDEASWQRLAELADGVEVASTTPQAENATVRE